MESRIQAVELKLMDIEMVVEQLNQVVIRHENTIDHLNRKIAEYQSQLQAAGTPLVNSADEPPPPHY